MRGDPEPSGAGGGDEAGVAEAGVGHAHVLLAAAQADDAGTGFGGTGGHEFVAFGGGPGGDFVGTGEDRCADAGDADLVEELEGGAKAVTADGVEGAGFVAAGVGAESHIAFAVIGMTGDVGPAELDGFDFVLAILLDVEDAAAFGAGEPFVAVGGEGVDLHGADVEGEDSEALDGIDEEEDAVAGADGAEGGEGGAVAGEELDEADGEEAGAASGGFDFFEGVGGFEPVDQDTFGGEFLPRVLVGGEFAAEGDDAVSGVPVETEGDGGDAFGGVFDDGDFAGGGVDHLGGGGAEAVIAGHPLAVVVGAPLFGVVGEPAHGVGRAAAERADGGVIEVDQLLSDREFVAVLLPNFETHPN